MSPERGFLEGFGLSDWDTDLRAQLSEHKILCRQTNQPANVFSMSEQQNMSYFTSQMFWSGIH